MKQFIALIVFVLICGCEQSTDNDQLILPPVTTEGKNVLACKIDGDIYISEGFRGSGLLAKDGVEAYMDVQFKSWWIVATRTSPKLRELETARLEMYVPLSVSVNDTVLLSDSIRASYGGNTKNDDYFTNETHRGRVIILRNDSQAISGTFEFDAFSYNTGKIIHITEGRFDIEKRN